MERFSINILRQQVYNICRLCGVDNPDKIAIINEDDDILLISEEEEPSLVRKIEECVGIKVHLQDQMPQNICTLCVDKVNDFYEYRLMCASTNLQTRTILNLPLVHPSVSLVKSEVVSAPPELSPDENSSDTKPALKRGPKTRNSKKQEVEPCGSEDTEAKPFPDGPTEKRLKFEFACQYCNEAYGQNSELERHLVVKHTPLIHKFGCGACMEYFDTASEYKDHNLWHKLSRTTFSCFRCCRKFVKIATLNKHIESNACLKGPRPSCEVSLVPDMRCTLCQKLFKTRNLYEWHGCFMRAKANCPKCGKYFMKKNLLMRHYMLYCNGTRPLLEPAYIPKEEPGTLPNGNLPYGGVAPTPGGTEVRRRGRPSASARDRMKEETLELPLSPSMLDLPDVKSETDSIPDTNHSQDETHDGGMDTSGKRHKAALVEETDKITTLLRSGATIDGNSDIATLNSMLSSVNEAIATISKVRKKKKKRDRGLGCTGDVSDKPANATSHPMVVLSMANVKQEALEDANLLAGLTNNVENGSNANETLEPPEGSTHSETGEGDREDHFAYGNDDNADSDTETAREEVEVINLDTSDEEGDPKQPNHTTRPQEREFVAPSVLQMVQVKRELLSDGDSDFEGYADASDYVVVKQEPTEETEESAETIQSNVETRPDISFSPYQALRIKIKKEKGWLNASMVGEEEQSVPSQAAKPAAPTRKRSSTGEAKAKKVGNPKPKRNNVPTPPTMDGPPETVSLAVQIKQEPLEHYELQQASATDYTPYDTPVQIKQEPQDDAAANNEPPRPTDIIAFDGTRIKSERVDNSTAKVQPPNNGLVNRPEPVRKALNPLSLTGVRLSGGKKSVPTANSSTSSSKAMINPFALLKQKTSVPTTVEGQEAETPEESESNQERQQRSSLPIITQVKSIDPKEHTLSLPFEGITAPSNEEEEQQYHDTTSTPDAPDNSNRTDGTGTDSTSTPLSLGNSSVPVVKTSELRIASVTSIQHVTEGYGHEESDKEAEQQENVTETGESLDSSQQPAAVPESDDLQDQRVAPVLDEAELAPDKPEDVPNLSSLPAANESDNEQKSLDGGIESQTPIPVASPSDENDAQVEEVTENVTENGQEMQSPPSPPSAVPSPTVEETPEDPPADESDTVEKDAQIGTENKQPTTECAETAPTVEEIPEEIPPNDVNVAQIEDPGGSVVNNAQLMSDCEVETQLPSIDSQSAEDIASAPVKDEEQATHHDSSIADSAVNLESTSNSSANVHETTTKQEEQQQEESLSPCESTVHSQDIEKPVEIPETQPELGTVVNNSGGDEAPVESCLPGPNITD